jgi:hypothetical protein
MATYPQLRSWGFPSDSSQRHTDTGEISRVHDRAEQNGHRLQHRRGSDGDDAQDDGGGPFDAPGGSQDQVLIPEEVPRIPANEDPLFPLNYRDVAAFIINKMIGTGIFVSPATVLILTRNKVEALFLWVLGLVYALVRYAEAPIPTSATN